jgi:hypothetical protein
MAHLIDKDAVLAEIEKLELCTMDEHMNYYSAEAQGEYNALSKLESFIDTLEVKEVGVSIPNIDDTLKEEGLDPDSKEAKVFKESYYMALEKLKVQKGE